MANQLIENKINIEQRYKQVMQIENQFYEQQLNKAFNFKNKVKSMSANERN